MEEINKAYATFQERDRIASLGGVPLDNVSTINRKVLLLPLQRSLPFIVKLSLPYFKL